uniref:Uncharacterized protein n=1 Tax=Ditylenchus dipsaci TaxID=166011 RepID=A0A915DTS0_9BILA
MKVQPIFSTPSPDDKSLSGWDALQSQQSDQRAASKPFSFSTFYGCFRYFVLMLGTLCMTSTTSNMISLNFTFICMAPQNGTTFRTPTVDYSLNQNHF